MNRAAELALLAQLVTETTAVAIGAMSGTAGVGKSALALHFAQRVAADFPDGQLYLNLRGFDPAGQPVGPAEAIRSLLTAFGVAGPPGDLDAQAALYRSTLAGRQVLVLLDNARDTDQVRPLLPGTPGCLVLVTSRSQLTGLAADGALLITLGLFSADVSHELLARHLGAGRVAGDADAARVIVERCARLPLALTTVGARAAAHPTFPLSRFADELTDAGTEAARRLDALDAGDSATRTRAVFSWSYRFLGAPTARLFRLLGVHPGPDIALPAAAALAGAPAARVRPLLTELARLHLIGEDRPGRFSFHDLLRAYAGELARATDSAEERRAALHRVSVHYVHTAVAAAQRLDPGRQQIPSAGGDPMKMALYVAVVALLNVGAMVAVTASAGAGPPSAIDEDAGMYAKDFGVPLAVARERLANQPAVDAYAADLEQRFPDRVAGIWFEHKPEYRLVVRLTAGATDGTAPGDCEVAVYMAMNYASDLGVHTLRA